MTMTLPKLPAPDVADIYEKSGETIEWLRQNIRVGFTSERGPAWWAQGFRTKTGEWAGIPEGSHFDGPVPIEEVRKLLAVPFAKGTVHVTYTDTEGNTQVSADPDIQPIVNQATGKVFSYPTKGYTIHPYLETLSDFITAIQYDQIARVGSVGLLKKGGQAFLQAVLPKTLEVAGYGYQPYLLGVTSVDLSRSTTWTTGALGAICDNTVTSALAGAVTKIKKRHSGAPLSVQWARENLGLRLAQTGDEIGQAIRELTEIEVSEADFAAWKDEMVKPVAPDPSSPTGGRAYLNTERKREEFTRLWTADAKVKPWAGTAFGVFQLDNTYRTWDGKVTGTGGRIEQNFSRLADGRLEKADTEAMEALAKVLGRRTILATA